MTEYPKIALDQSVRQRRYSSVSQFDIKHNTTPGKIEHKKPEQNTPGKQHVSSPLQLYESSGDVRTELPVTLGINIDIII